VVIITYCFKFNLDSYLVCEAAFFCLHGPKITDPMLHVIKPKNGPKLFGLRRTMLNICNIVKRVFLKCFIYEWNSN